MINAIFAVDQYGGMGNNGTLPWPHNASDLANFKTLTTGHVVVMGRNTWDDPKMPKPLPGCIVYVASNRPMSKAGRIQGDIVEKVLALEKQHPDRIIWVIGGSAILEACIDIFDEVHLTHIKGSYKIDTKINLKAFLTGLVAKNARVASDYQSTIIRYEPLFKRTTAGT